MTFRCCWPLDIQTSLNIDVPFPDVTGVANGTFLRGSTDPIVYSVTTERTFRRTDSTAEIERDDSYY